MEKMLIEPNHNYSFDEICFIDLWTLIIKWKKLIIGFPLSLLIIMAIFIFTNGPVYESRAIIQIGQIGPFSQVFKYKYENQEINSQQYIPLEDSLELMERLREKHKAGLYYNIDIERPVFFSVSIDTKKANNIIAFSARSNNASYPQKYLEIIMKEVLKQHQELYSKVLNTQLSLLKSLQLELSNIEAEIAFYDKKIKSSNDIVLSSIYIIEKSEMIKLRLQMKEQIMELELRTSPIYLKPTEVLLQPTYSTKPVEPRTKLYLLVAGVIGLALGVFMAFIAEFIEIRKNKTTLST